MFAARLAFLLRGLKNQKRHRKERVKKKGSEKEKKGEVGKGKRETDKKE
jgi:hypothetical protein